MSKSSTVAHAWIKSERATLQPNPDKVLTEIICSTVAELFGSGPGEFYAAKPVEPGRVTMEEWRDLTAKDPH